MSAPSPLVAKAHEPLFSSAMIMGSGRLASTTGLGETRGCCCSELGPWAPVGEPHAATVSRSRSSRRSAHGDWATMSSLLAGDPVYSTATQPPSPVASAACARPSRLARLAEVSPKTVSNVVNGTTPVSDSMRARVEAAMPRARLRADPLGPRPAQRPQRSDRARPPRPEHTVLGRAGAPLRGLRWEPDASGSRSRRPRSAVSESSSCPPGPAPTRSTGSSSLRRRCRT